MPDPVDAPPAAPAAVETPPVAPVETPPTAVETPPAAVETPPAVEPEVDPFDDEAVDKFDRAYVEKLRTEAGSKRVALKPFEEAFEPYSEAERGILMSLIKDLANDDTAASAAERMRKIADTILAPAEEPETPPAETPPAEVKMPETPEELQALLDEHLAKREQTQAQTQAETKAQDDAVAAVIKETTDLGYVQGTPEFQTVLLRASSQYDGDVGKAHAAIEAEKQAWLDKFVEEQAAAGNAFPKPIGGGTPPADPEGGPPKDWGGSRRSMLARLGKA